MKKLIITAIWILSSKVLTASSVIFTYTPTRFLENLRSNIILENQDAHVRVYRPSDFTESDIFIRAQIGDLSTPFSLEVTAEPVETDQLYHYPSPLIPINPESRPVILGFVQSFQLTEEEAIQFADLDSVILEFSGRDLIEPLSYTLSKSIIPEPSNYSLIGFICLGTLLMRRRPLDTK